MPPHPARAVKIRGPKSRAGFNPNPALTPKHVPIVNTINPIKKGAIFDPPKAFFLSTRAKMVPTKIAVPKTLNKGERTKCRTTRKRCYC